MPTSTKRKAPGKLAAPVSKANVKVPNKATIDESRTSVSAGDAVTETIEISSGEEQDDYESSDDEEAKAQLKALRESMRRSEAFPTTNGKPAKKQQSGDEDGSDAEETSPSFGELLRGNEAIDVPALLQQSISKDALATTSKQAVVPPSHQSLTTVLTQALKTDDSEQLERCLHTSDTTTIRNTIERIDSSLAGTLLNKLAARLYRRPGRAGTLMVWVQWTLVAHGGALASQPGVVSSLNGLQKVMAERAKGLNSLLALQGKLDLLQAQMSLRRKMKQNANPANADEAEDEDDENVIWVEGETENNSPDANASRRKRARRDSGSDEEAPITNGFGGDSEDDDEDSAAEGVDADDSDAEEALDENEIEFDDGDDSMGEDEESDGEAAPPSKFQKVANFLSGKRK